MCQRGASIVMAASYPTKLLLAHRSGDRCAMPTCGRTLTPQAGAGPTHVGEAAHIAGEHDGKGKHTRSARYDPSMTDAARNHYNNLIYVCGTCHTLIDAMPQGESDFPVTRLLEIKRAHESTVRTAIRDAFADVGFAELQEATNWAAHVQPAATTSPDYSLLRVEDKIRKNDLDDDSRAVIAMGLGVASEVARFVESVAQTDPDFPERLKAGFLEQYWKLRHDGARGGELFELMCAFSQQGFHRQAQRSAGLAVLVHMFETCEVFEK